MFCNANTRPPLCLSVGCSSVFLLSWHCACEWLGWTLFLDQGLKTLRGILWRPQWLAGNAGYPTHGCKQREALWCCCHPGEIRKLQTEANRESKAWYSLPWVCFCSVLFMDEQSLDIWDIKRSEEKIWRILRNMVRLWSPLLENEEYRYFPGRNGIFLPLK